MSSTSEGASRGAKIIKGALILTAAGLISRVLGFAYRIYMSNVIGAEGMGLYQLIIPLYTLAWSISCAGITTTVSKLVAKENARNNTGNISRIVKLAMAMTFALGFIVMCVLFFGAELIAESFLSEPRTVMAIQILSVATPFMAVASAIRGYYTGLSKMHIPAVSQVLEQVVRMIAISIAVSRSIGRGLEYAAAAAVIGIVAGEIFSFAYVLYSYRLGKVSPLSPSKEAKEADLSRRALLSSIAVMALPLTLNRVTGSLLAAVENVLIPRSLMAFGLSQGEAMAAFGRITGMAMPLIFFPSAFLMSLSVSIVPAVSEAHALKKLEKAEPILSKAFLFTILVGVGAAAVFLSFSRELGMVIYNQDIGNILFMLAFICPLWYFNITLSGVLNGLGAMGAVFRNNLVSSVITILFIVILVPRYGVTAFAGGWFLGILAQITLGVLRVRKEISLKLPLGNGVIKPILAAAFAGLTARFLAGRFAEPLLGERLGLAVSVILLTLLYVAGAMLLGVVSAAEMRRVVGKIGKGR